MHLADPWICNWMPTGQPSFLEFMDAYNPSLVATGPMQSLIHLVPFALQCKPEKMNTELSLRSHSLKRELHFDPN